MKYINLVYLKKSLLITILVGCSGMIKLQVNDLIGTWEGNIKAPQIHSVILIFKKNGTGVVKYIESNRYENFRFSMANDSTISLVRNNFKTEHHIKINRNKLMLRPVKIEKSIEIINSLDFVKKGDSTN